MPSNKAIKNTVFVVDLVAYGGVLIAMLLILYAGYLTIEWMLGV